MDGQALHLAINHFPIILAVVGTAAALVAFLMRKRGVLLYALATLTLAGLASYPAVLTGDEAEEVLEKRWFIDEKQIKEHEESADVSNILLIITGVVSAASWYRVLRSPREAAPATWMLALVLLLGLSSSISVAYTSWEGGFIVSKNEKLKLPPMPTSGAGIPALGVHADKFAVLGEGHFLQTDWLVDAVNLSGVDT